MVLPPALWSAMGMKSDTKTSVKVSQRRFFRVTLMMSRRHLKWNSATPSGRHISRKTFSRSHRPVAFLSPWWICSVKAPPSDVKAARKASAKGPGEASSKEITSASAVSENRSRFTLPTLVARVFSNLSKRGFSKSINPGMASKINCHLSCL